MDAETVKGFIVGLGKGAFDTVAGLVLRDKATYVL